MVTMKPVRGVYRQGKIELVETPSFPDGTIVDVSAVVDEKTIRKNMIRRGMFPGPPFTTKEDFRDAEYQDPK